VDAQNINIFSILLHSSLIVKGVLMLLIFASVTSWAIIVKKKRFIKSYKMANDHFREVYNKAISLKDAADSCASIPDSPLKTTFLAGYRELGKINASCEGSQQNISEHFQKFGMNSLERALKQAANEVSDSLALFLPTLASIGSVSPFVGLFGTVWGIVNSFTGLAGGGATLEAVAPGIAEALVATAIGLVAAIPAVWFFNLFTNHNTILINELDSFGQDFLNLVERTLIEGDQLSYRAPNTPSNK